MNFWIIFKRDFVNIILNPVLLFSNTIFPFILVLVLGYLTSGNYGSAGVNSYDYYGISILIFTILNVSMTASNSFMEKSIKTTNLRIMYSPISTFYIYISKIVATFVFTSMCYGVLIILSKMIFAVNFGGTNFIYVVIVLILFNLLTSTIGVLFCCIFKSEELSNKILSMTNNIFGVLGGIFFQMDGFGDKIEKLSYISPVKWVAEGIFKIIYDKDLSLFIPTCIVFIALIIIMLIGCKLSFKVEDYV